MHWYDNKGQKRYEVPYKDPSKGSRPTTLADAKKLNLAYGTTDILSSVKSHGLEIWKHKQLLDSVIETEYDVNVKAYLADINETYFKKLNKASDRGNILHKKLELVFKGEGLKADDEDFGFIIPAWRFITDRFTGCLWKSEETFTSYRGYGGTVDLVSHNGDGIIIDFKSVQADILDKNLAFDDRCAQLAAYRQYYHDVTGEYFKCYNYFISAIREDEGYLHEWTEPQLKRGTKMFNCLLEYTKLKNNHSPKISLTADGEFGGMYE